MNKSGLCFLRETKKRLEIQKENILAICALVTLNEPESLIIDKLKSIAERIDILIIGIENDLIESKEKLEDSMRDADETRHYYD